MSTIISSSSPRLHVTCRSLAVVLVLLGVASLASAGAQPAQHTMGQGLRYDAQSRTPVPIPPAEQALQTVTAEPWLDLPGLKDLEAPAFERSGSLLFCDVAGGRVLRVDAEQKVSTVVRLEGLGPGGIAIHKDGRIFIAALDIPGRKGEIISVRPDGTDMQVIVPLSAGFLPNDLVFDHVGGLYFTDFRGSATQAAGGVYYIAPGTTKPVAVLSNLSMANGVALSPDGKELWTAEFGRNALYRVQLADATHPTDLGTAIAYRFTGPAPDSMRIDGDGNLYVALYGQGRVLAFGRNGVPIGQILMPGRDAGQSLATTNLAIRPGTDEVYIVAGAGGGAAARILRSRIFANALPLYSHR